MKERERKVELKKFYEEVGGDYGAVLQRLLKPDMIMRFVSRFADDPSYSELKAAIAAGDLETAFRAAHTLKGTAATLGLDRLASAASELTERLRGAAEPPEPEHMLAVDKAYQTVVEKIGQIG